MTRSLLILLTLCMALPAAAADPKKSVLFGNDLLWRVDIQMTPAEYDGMQPANGARFPGFGQPQPPMPKVAPKPGDMMRDLHRNVFGVDLPLAFGNVTIDGKNYPKVGIRYKGNGTYLESARFLKRSLKIDLNKFDEDARFCGVKTINLHSGVADPSKGREAFAYYMYRQGGVPAPLTSFADVSLTVPGKFDKEYLGLFTIVEQVDKNFLKTHFKNDDGLILKPERMLALDYLGDNWDAYKANYVPKRDATPEEAKRTIEFVRLVAKADEAQFAKEIANYLDIKAFLRFMAVTAYVVNLDSFFALGHNYILYLHPETKKFSFIPWDVDRSLANFGIFGNADQQMDLNVMHPYPGDCRLADRVLGIPQYRDQYQAILKELSQGPFTKQRLMAEVETMEKHIKASVERDTKVTTDRKETGGFNAFFGKPPELKVFVEKRTASVDAQLAGKSKGFTPQAFNFGPPPNNGPAMPIAKGIVEAVDANKDGKVTEEEFLSGMKKLFHEWDRNKNGTLDANKIADALQKLLPPGGPPKK